ncbi:hypothetical protein IAU60_002293 [Kwoniella sp. DSM 27419]
MVQASSSGKNLWVAASDGDLERVQYLIENEGMTPNDKDSNSYTPMHAAASYAHMELLTYLLSKNGDPNVTDDDGETPLFVVESLEVAQFLVERGCDPTMENEEGMTAADSLEEDQPEITAWLQSLNPQSASAGADVTGAEGEGEGAGQISQLALDNFTSEQSSALMVEAQRIMAECAETGEDPDERLRAVVEAAVAQGLAFGREAGQEAEGAQVTEGGEEKRVRDA